MQKTIFFANKEIQIEFDNLSGWDFDLSFQNVLRNSSRRIQIIFWKFFLSIKIWEQRF